MEIETDIDIRSAIWKLPQAHRTVLILYYSLGYSVKEIAEILEVPTGTVKSRLARARDDMKSLLRRDLSRYVFAKECAIRIDKQQKECYNNAVIDNGIII